MPSISSVLTSLISPSLWASNATASAMVTAISRRDVTGGSKLVVESLRAADDVANAFGRRHDHTDEPAARLVGRRTDLYGNLSHPGNGETAQDCDQKEPDPHE
jgi:hypothetical protein